MSSEDRYWLREIKGRNDRYKIMVDNDCVFIVDLVKEEDVYTFDEYGWRFALELLQYFGFNAEEV